MSRTSTLPWKKSRRRSCPSDSDCRAKAVEVPCAERRCAALFARAEKLDGMSIMEHPKGFCEGAVHRHHHGRQRPLGQEPRPAPHRRPQKGRTRSFRTSRTTAMSWALRRCISTHSRPKTGSVPPEEVGAIMRLFGEYLHQGLRLQEPEHPHLLHGRPHCAGPQAAEADERAGDATRPPRPA